MARGALFSRFKKRVEEIRVSELSPVELQAEECQRMADEVTDLHDQLEELAEEMREMDRKYHLQWNVWGVPAAGFGNFEATQIVMDWWKDYAKRVHKAQYEFNQALAKWAALKGSVN